MLLTGHLAHTSLAYFLKNLVMAMGRADHEIPPHCEMQLRSRLHLAGVNGNRQEHLQ